MRKIRVALVTGAVLVAIPGNASTFVALPETELVGGSESIIQGRVVGQTSFWNESGRLIVTEAVVRVRETIVGESPKRVTVRTVGGRVGDYTVEAPGFPRFEPRERVILFLEAGPSGTRQVRGYQQGHFEVVERLDGVRLAVPRIEEGTRLVTRSGQLLPQPRSMPLSEFKQSIRRIARDTDARER